MAINTICDVVFSFTNVVTCYSKMYPKYPIPLGLMGVGAFDVAFTVGYLEAMSIS